MCSLFVSEVTEISPAHDLHGLYTAERDTDLFGAVQHSRAVHVRHPPSDVRRSGAPGHQHYVALYRLKNHVPVLSLGVIGNGVRNCERVGLVQIDARQISSEVRFLNVRHKAPAIVRVRSGGPSAPRQSYVARGPVHYLATSPGNLLDVYSMDGNLRLVKSAKPATAVTDVMSADTDLSVMVSGGSMCGLDKSLAKYGRHVTRIGSRLVMATSRYGISIRATLSTVSCSSGALLLSASAGRVNLNATG